MPHKELLPDRKRKREENGKRRECGVQMKVSKKSMKYLNSCRKMDACVYAAVDAHIDMHKNRLLPVFGKAKVQAWYEDEVDFMQQQMEDGCMAEEALYMLENPSGVLQSVPGYGIIQYEKHKSIYDRINGCLEHLPVCVHNGRKKAGQLFAELKKCSSISCRKKENDYGSFV